MLKGKKVRLRSVEKKDIDFFHELWNDEEITKFDGCYHIPPSKEFILENFYKIMNIDKKFLTILNEEKVLIGYISYSDFKDLGGNYEIGVTISKNYWHKGYAQDAIKTILRFLFMNKGAHRVELEVVDLNERAIKCYLNCGFVKEGVRRNRYFVDGQYRNVILMSILKEEYLKEAGIVYKNKMDT